MLLRISNGPLNALLANSLHHKLQHQKGDKFIVGVSTPVALGGKKSGL
jgi:hypothetical protein